MDTGAPVSIFDAFATPDETMLVLRKLDATPRPNGPLVPAPREVFDFLAARLSERDGRGYISCGPLLTFNDTSSGIHPHRDEPYMGGDMTLLLYLTTPDEGGHTCVGGDRVAPVSGRAVLFGISDLHHGEPVSGATRKVVVGVEMSRK